MLTASLGLHIGATRLIAHYRAIGDETKVRATVHTAIFLAALVSTVVCVLLFWMSAPLAELVFHTKDMVTALKLTAMAIPFVAMVNVICAVFRGFDRVEPMVYFQFIMLNALFPLFLLIPLLFYLPFESIFYCYLASSILTFIALSSYAGHKLPSSADTRQPKEISHVLNRLLIFSLPLLGNTLSSVVISSMDMLSLGYFKSASLVGIYNAAYPLAQFIVQPLTAIALIFIPVGTWLYSQNSTGELRRSYTIITKWLVSLTIPIAIVLTVFPEAVLNYFFGPQYIGAANALRILVAGFMINNFFGPNNSMLIAVGDSMWLLWAGLAAAVASVILNITLVPQMGIIGAATASVGTMFIANTICVARLFFKYRAHPFSWNLIKPLAVSIGLILVLQFIITRYIVVEWWMIPLLFILYCMMYAVIVIVTRSFEREDAAMLTQIINRSGLKLDYLENHLKRYL
jgi:O-antigen/teichoic acid export membrane protein